MQQTSVNYNLINYTTSLNIADVVISDHQLKQNSNWQMDVLTLTYEIIITTATRIIELTF